MNKLTFREKQLVSLRLKYLGGYSGYFAKGVVRLAEMGFTRDEMVAACVDETMRGWIDDALQKMRAGTPR